MVDRIRKIAEKWSLSPTGFADRIEVSRPVMSHIFSGRNRPSLEVMQKIGAAFPEVDLAWLLYGKGQMLKSLAPKPAPEAAPVPPVQKQPGPEKNIAEKPPEEKVQKTVAPAKEKLPVPASGKPIQKVMIFYADQTFEVFYPGA